MCMQGAVAVGCSAGQGDQQVLWAERTDSGPAGAGAGEASASACSASAAADRVPATPVSGACTSQAQACCSVVLDSTKEAPGLTSSGAGASGSCCAGTTLEP